MAYELRDFSDTAPATTVAADITGVSTTITITSGTGYPSGGAAGNFLVQIASELILCSARSGGSLTVAGGVAGRGQNGTSAASHVAGSTVNHVHTALNDGKEANYAVSKTVGKVTTAGDMLVADAVNSFARLAKGTNGQVLQMTAGSVAWGAVALAANQVTATEIAADAVGSSEIASDAVGSAEIAAGAVGVSELATGILPQFIAFTKTGALTTGVGVQRFPFPTAGTIINTRLSINTAPTGVVATPIAGAGVVVDVNKNGTTIYTTQANRPNIQASAFAQQAITAPDVTAMTAGDYLTVDIDYKGSTVAGSDLTIVVYYLV